MAVNLGPTKSPRYYAVGFNLNGEECFRAAKNTEKEKQKALDLEMSQFITHCEGAISLNVDKYFVEIYVSAITNAFPNWLTYIDDVIKAAKIKGFSMSYQEYAEKPNFYIGWDVDAIKNAKESFS